MITIKIITDKNQITVTNKNQIAVTNCCHNYNATSNEEAVRLCEQALQRAGFNVKLSFTNGVSVKNIDKELEKFWIEEKNNENAE